jgi:hypothetical protein
MYRRASWALTPERASAKVKIEKNLGQNTKLEGIGISPCLTTAKKTRCYFGISATIGISALLSAVSATPVFPSHNEGCYIVQVLRRIYAVVKG